VAGLREGELFALERPDVDLLHKTVSVTKQAQTVGGERLVAPPKSREGVRKVSIPDFLASALERHLVAHVGPEPSALVFTNTDGNPLDRNHFAKTWRRAAAAAGYPGVHFHDLRSCARTLRAQQGATVKELMAFGGHATPAVAMTYQRAAAERERELAAKTDEALGAALIQVG
jgi:integrase